MVEFCLHHGFTWAPPLRDDGGEASARVALELTAGLGDERAIAALTEWIGQRTSS